MSRPWIICENCFYFDTMNCKRNAPVIAKGETKFPFVNTMAWCGEWQCKHGCQSTLVHHNKTGCHNGPSVEEFCDEVKKKT